MIVGIDEAGRGPAIGPLVLSGVALPTDRLGELNELGLRDSKAYGSGAAAVAERARLANQIHAVASVFVEVAEAEEVDTWAADGGLNRLEQAMASRILGRIARVRRAIADGARLFAPLTERFPQLEAIDRADQDHPIVAAASIVAKTERDRLLASLLQPHQDEFGPIRGGGYPNGATARFLRQHVERYGQLPDGVRKSWSWAVLHQLTQSCDTTVSDQS